MTTKRNLAFGEYLQGLHGGEIHQVAQRIGIDKSKILDFSSNINIFAAKLSKTLINSLSYPADSYPDSSCTRLRQHIAKHEEIESENIICGAGSSSLIWHYLQSFKPKKVVLLGPMFSEFVVALNALKIEWEIIKTDPLESFAVSDKILNKLWRVEADLAIICTPNNPAGIFYDNIESILKALRSARILIDLSYREFTYANPNYHTNSWKNYSKIANPGTHIATLHSFTKFFCCPGVRLGYLLAHPKHINVLNELMPSWSVDQFAQDLGLLFLENITEFRKSLKILEEQQYNFGIELRRSKIFIADLILEGTNFFCCKINEETGISSQELQKHLLKHGILIRNCDNIPGMPKNFIRIQVRTEPDNSRLIAALKLP